MRLLVDLEGSFDWIDGRVMENLVEFQVIIEPFLELVPKLELVEEEGDRKIDDFVPVNRFMLFDAVRLADVILQKIIFHNTLDLRSTPILPWAEAKLG